MSNSYQRDFDEIDRARTRAPMARACRDAAFELLDRTLDESERYAVETICYALGDSVMFGQEIPLEDARQLLIGLRSLLPEN